MLFRSSVNVGANAVSDADVTPPAASEPSSGGIPGLPGGIQLPAGVPTPPGGIPNIPGGIPQIPGGVPNIPGR